MNQNLFLCRIENSYWTIWDPTISENVQKIQRRIERSIGNRKITTVRVVENGFIILEEEIFETNMTDDEIENFKIEWNSTGIYPI